MRTSYSLEKSNWYVSVLAQTLSTSNHLPIVLQHKKNLLKKGGFKTMTCKYYWYSVILIVFAIPLFFTGIEVMFMA